MYSQVIGKKNAHVKVITQPNSTRTAAVVVDNPTDSVAANYARFNQFWDLMDVIHVHGYVRSAMSVIGRSAVGAWWNITRNMEYPATDVQRKRLMRFYTTPDKSWDNIKDYQSAAYKLMIGAMYLRYFGQCAYQVLRNENGKTVGYDFLPGYVQPNVDTRGYFKSPAFTQYPTKNPRDAVFFENSRDIIFIVNPDWNGRPAGGTDLSSLSDFAIPIDLYLQVAARSYLQNRDKPEAIYILPSDISDQAFDSFVQAIEERYSGPANVGRNPIAVQGELDIKELSKLPADLPYQESRGAVREEVLAASGVPGAKLGLTSEMSSANLREARREFHESTMRPLFKLIEIAFYEQVHIREFGIYGWEFKFGNPDFLTAVERATVHMRYYGINAISPNEIRGDLGMQPRLGKLGGFYKDDLETANSSGTPGSNDTTAPQGSPPEGRETSPDSPSQIGEPTLDDQDPPRGDQHDEERAIYSELEKWRAFTTKRLKRNKPLRKFECISIPLSLAIAIEDSLTEAVTIQEAHAVFDNVISLLEEELNEN